jgi:hypothetical protein
MSEEITWADYYDENEDREPRELLLEALSRFGPGSHDAWISGAAPASTPSGSSNEAGGCSPPMPMPRASAGCGLGSRPS